MGGVLLTLSASASPYADVTAKLGSSFQDMVTNTVAMIGTVLPVAITIFGCYMLIGFAKRVFKKVAGNS